MNQIEEFLRSEVAKRERMISIACQALHESESRENELRNNESRLRQKIEAIQTTLDAAMARMNSLEPVARSARGIDREMTDCGRCMVIWDSLPEVDRTKVEFERSKEVRTQ